MEEKAHSTDTNTRDEIIRLGEQMKNTVSKADMEKSLSEIKVQIARTAAASTIVMAVITAIAVKSLS